MTIQRITRAYVRTYTDSGQRTAYVEWVDTAGEKGRTESPVRANTGTLAQMYGIHMGALMARAICHGVTIEREVW